MLQYFIIFVVIKSRTSEDDSETDKNHAISWYHCQSSTHAFSSYHVLFRRHFVSSYNFLYPWTPENLYATKLIDEPDKNNPWARK